MKLLQLINAKARQITLFALFLTLSTSLSALSISDWAGSFFGRNVEPQQEELFSEKIEEFGEDHIEPKEYSDNNEGVVEEKIEEKDARGFSGKKAICSRPISHFIAVYITEKPSALYRKGKKEVSS